MSDIKCPFCNQKLEPIGTSGQFQCGTWGCDASFNFIATRDVWEYIDRTRKVLDKGMEHITGLNNMIESWCKLLQNDKDTSTKYAILKSAISAYMETKGGGNE